MRKASVRDLRYSFKKIERLLREGEEIQITKRRRVIARLIRNCARRDENAGLSGTATFHLWREVVAGQRCRAHRSRSEPLLKIN